MYLGLKVKVKVAQWRPTLGNLMDCTGHEILQARILEWVGFLFSRGFFQPRFPTGNASRFFTSWATRKAQELLEWVAYTLSSRSSQPRNPTGISCIVGGFFTKWTMREALICLMFFSIWWFVCSCFDTTLF